MKNSKFKKTISFLVLVVYFFTLPIAFGGIVLCQGHDGHVAIEFVTGGHCNDFPLGKSDNHEHFNSSEHSETHCELGHCGDCEDIPLAFVSSTQAIQKSIAPLKHSAPGKPPAFLALHIQQKQSAAGFLARNSPLNNYPYFLYTIILLI